MTASASGAPSEIPRRTFLASMGLAAAGFATAQGSVTAPVANAGVIKESPSIGACGPYAVANALSNGDAGCRRAFERLPGQTPVERAHALIAQYGNKPSETYGPQRARFLAGQGISTEDLTYLTGDVLRSSGLGSVAGDFLDLQLGEASHLHRVHGLFSASIAAGWPPLLEVRAFAADSSSRSPSWINLYAHWLALLGIEEIAAGGGGFACRFADSYTGHVIPAFVYAERFRPYMATRGFNVKRGGAKDWHWLEGEPYLLLSLPDVPLEVQTRPWHERTIVACTYMIHRAA